MTGGRKQPGSNEGSTVNGPEHLELQDLLERLPGCMLSDRYRLQRQLDKLAVAGSLVSAPSAALEKLKRKIHDSRDLALARAGRVPAIGYPPELPISGCRDIILDTLAQHQVVIIAGETGSGKTTQLPKMCLEAGRGVTGLIGHTQPRRLAARTVASRIADELSVALGETVGYQVRFKDNSTEQTLVKLMTDGILLAEIQRDRYLNRYDTIIIDEAHERSLNIDFILGYLKRLLPRRADLKVIITSATIDVERFSSHFDNAPVIEVSGRTYPVAYRYRPITPDDDMYQAINLAVEELLLVPQKGDMLVFLSGEREIREAALSLRRCQFPHLDIVPLYARLNLAEQNRIFQAHRGIRVVLATNVAETSLTVPGIRYVIDTGLARISRYSYRTKVQQLPIEPISQASANQRAGRCGRMSDGICIRLYSEDDYNQRPAFTTPEILRTNLAAVILQMLQLRIGDVRHFPFLEPPDNRLINDGFALLKELQAVDSKDRLTSSGQRQAQFSVDPRLARMLLAAETEGCVREVLVIAAALSIQDPRERPADKRQAADQQHAQWRDKSSDFVSILNLWSHFEAQRQTLSRNQFAQYCRKSFVSYLRMVEWRDLHHQLHMDCRQIGIKVGAGSAEYDNVHRALLAGLLAHVGFRHEGREFQGVRNRKFHLFPGSGLAARPPKWVMCAEMVETSRLYGHYNASINVEWLPALAGHLVAKQYSEPHYDKDNGRVMAYEKQSLYGLTIADRRKVDYGPIDPKVCREIFIQSALVEGAYLRTKRTKVQSGERVINASKRGSEKSSKANNKKLNIGEFAVHNAELLTQLHDLEERMRRRDILAEEAVLYQFYDERIPAEVVSLATFERWRKTVEKSSPQMLFVDRELLTRNAPSSQEQAQFPHVISWGDVDYQLSYLFEPGQAQDGVTVNVPLALLHEIPRYRFDWLVPGLLRDKCIALMKGLPKQWRKHFVPVPEFVDRVMPRLVADDKPLHVALGEQLRYVCGVEVPVQCWQPGSLDTFYRMNFRLLDERGNLLENSRDLDQLRQRFRQHLQSSIAQHASPQFERTGITRWDFGELPETHVVNSKRHAIRVYPALCDDQDSASLKLCDSPGLAASYSVNGVVRLSMLENSQIVKYLEKDVLKNKALLLRAMQLPDRKVLVEDMIFAGFQSACFVDRPLPRSEAEYRKLIARGKDEIVSTVNRIESMLLSMADDLVELYAVLGRKRANFPGPSTQVEAQMRELFRPGLCREAGLYWLAQYPRYIKAALQRMQKHLVKTDREESFTREMDEFTDTLAGLRCGKPHYAPADLREIQVFRFMIEEYRVSHYAQHLKTAVPVSSKRLAKQWQMLSERLG